MLSKLSTGKSIEPEKLMVEIAQIFNNNSALVNLGNQKQAIVKGKGIAFNKSKGSNLPKYKINKG
ncbi:hypothetical protein LCUFL03_P60003 [Latilactobacillus curvatus]|nr:hypothetical protein LCUFL03_P60003 [Latilactobacillus curvatus]